MADVNMTKTEAYNEENVYEEISKAIIQARKAGMKAFPIGAMGCGVFANDPKVIGRLAARAFLDYGGDMIPMFNMFKKGSNIEILKALVEAFNAELVARGGEAILKVDDLMDDTRLKQVAEKLTLLQPSMLEIKEKMSPVIDWDVFTDVNNEIEEDQLVEICNKLRNNIGIVKNSGLTEKQKTLLIKENLSNLLNEIFLTRLDDLEKEEQQSKDIASYREHVETTIKEKLDEVVKRFVDEDDLKNGMTALSNMMVPCLNKLGVLSLKVKNEIKIQTTESELDKLLDFINELRK